MRGHALCVATQSRRAWPLTGHARGNATPIRWEGQSGGRGARGSEVLSLLPYIASVPIVTSPLLCGTFGKRMESSGRSVMRQKKIIKTQEQCFPSFHPSQRGGRAPAQPMGCSFSVQRSWRRLEEQRLDVVYSTALRPSHSSTDMFPSTATVAMLLIIPPMHVATLLMKYRYGQ